MSVYRCKLKAISPIHIGDEYGERNPMEFFEDGNDLCLINEGALAGELGKLGLVDDFVKFTHKERPTLQGYLESIGTEKKEKIKDRIISRRIDANNQKRINSLFTAITDALNQTPYIPGTSIKGALKSQFLCSFLADDQAELNNVMNRIKSSRRPPPRKFAGRELDDLVLRELDGTRQKPHQDWFRGLRVSDAFFDQGKSELIEARVVSLNKSGKGSHFGARGARIYKEVIPSGAELKLTIETDDSLWSIMSKENGPLFSSIKELLDKCAKQIVKQADEEAEFWERAGYRSIPGIVKRYQSAGANICLGWGGGYLSTTVGLLMSQAERMLIKEKYYKRGNYNEFPNSRRAAFAGENPTALIGWARLNVEEVKD